MGPGGRGADDREPIYGTEGRVKQIPDIKTIFVLNFHTAHAHRRWILIDKDRSY